ncbi:MAG: hypothetical protein COB02_16345 [Candidatus Cloacimonadota bacterium]|nr:MAG: hypothetical protein COB02_16345 [Candidatus Cloacimonadota bacterium]
MSKILLVENNTDLSEVLSSFLKVSGHEVITAYDGKQGFNLFKSISFDLVITDIIMPKVDGLEMLEMILKLNPKTLVITLSGGHRLVPDVANQYLEASMKMGAYFSFRKPFKMNDLLKAIDQLTSC